ncbi:glycosyltransferase [Lacrimispora sp.]|uniref:glycosyltransferase n=1 Tax=Lacrimispora sp. TaxID=2719234 RepID=UPI0028ADD66C|nr:glycosyltransferase [Lacrimispora sp.]
MKISVIVPVYNVYEWLDACMESLLNQSFRDFEVILINDGSTDGSGKKCLQWKYKDKRIRYLDKANEGLSATRNLGICESKGKYLTFLDSDDWLDKNFLLDLYTEAEKFNADIAECDVYRFNDTNGHKSYRSCYGSMAKEYSKEEHLIYGNTAIWKCLIRRDIFLKYNIYFPDCHSPARAVYSLLIALSNKIVNVKKPLYYYRTFRKGSLSEKPRDILEDNNSIGIMAFAELVHEFKRCGIYEKYKFQLERTIKYNLSDILAAFFHRKPEKEFSRMITDYRSFIKQQFTESNEAKYITLGGYNLNRITWSMNMLHVPSLRFNFSSLISIVNPINQMNNILCNNKYREIMINRDTKSDFWYYLKKENPQFVIMDFIEERFDVMYSNGGYLTVSDAYKDCDVNLVDTHIIDRNSIECKKIWENSCIIFIQEIQQRFPDIKIILVKNYLSEYKGNIHHKELHENNSWIKSINSILKYYYDFFMSKCNSALEVESSECQYYITDKDYEYGAIPSHLNELVNREIAYKIEKLLI